MIFFPTNGELIKDDSQTFVFRIIVSQEEEFQESQGNSQQKKLYCF